MHDDRNVREFKLYCFIDCCQRTNRCIFRAAITLLILTNFCNNLSNRFSHILNLLSVQVCSEIRGPRFYGTSAVRDLHIGTDIL